MKKAHIHILRLLFVILMIVFASVWVLKFREPTPVEKPVEIAKKQPAEAPEKAPEAEKKKSLP